ncbi:MAG: alkaline phosphatase family protein [Chloroflexia bacterium]|nr:alkaline phosphatase family protein [Chloroflexia bacterium]
MEKKFLLIGLDGASFSLLDILEQRGLLPHLAALRRQSAWGNLLSTIPPFTVPAWSSMMTGKGPGKHSVISFFEHPPEAYQCQSRGTFVNGSSVDGERLWETLSRAGRDVIVINFPMTYPPRPVKGCLITGMLTPYSATDFTYPPELAAELAGYQIDLQYSRQGDHFDIEAYPSGTRLIAELQDMALQRAQTGLRLMREQPWDLLAVVFTGPDRMCHFFWPDLVHPERADPEIVAASEEYFRNLDDRIGQLLEEVGPETMVMVVSDHGFGPAPAYRFNPNLWLEQQGWLRRRQSGRESGLRGQVLSRVYRQPALRRLIKNLLPRSWRGQVRQSAREDIEAAIDWPQTQAYFAPMSNYICGIEINRQGLKRSGCVPPEEVQPLREQIMRAALEIVNPLTGQRLVSQAQTREQVYQGPYVETFPDVILTLDPEVGCSPSLRGKAIIEAIETPRRPGDHRREGVWMLRGGPIRPGEVKEARHIEDVMPTILYFLDQELPDDLDGQIITTPVEQSYLAENTVRYRPATATERQGAFGQDSEEQELVEDRLRGLGYL